LFFLPQTSGGAGPPHPWDYVAHLLVSFIGIVILFFVLLLPLKSFGISPKIGLVISAGVMLVIGIIKEVNDNNLGKTDMAGDILANITGIALSVIIVHLLFH
jgi:hypothetical protein